MNPKFYSTYIIGTFLICFSFYAKAQNGNNTFRLGINYGTSLQLISPFRNLSYSHKSRYLKIQINTILIQKKKWKFELNLEPSYYVSKHRFLSKNSAQTSGSFAIIDQRERFKKVKIINEYVLNIGIISRFNILQDL